MITVGALQKDTLKNKILMWIYHNWPAVDQWAINKCDEYPCYDCIWFSSMDCLKHQPFYCAYHKNNSCV